MVSTDLWEFLILTGLADNLAWVLLPTVLAMLVLGYRRFRRWRSGQSGQAYEIQKTTLGAFSGSIAPEARAITGFGMGARPHETLGELTLRPSWGMRIYPVGLFGFFYYFINQMYVSGPMTGGVHIGAMDVGFVGLLFGLTFWSILYFNTYDLRYDRDRFIHRSLLLARREYDWSEVRSLRDDNAFFFVVRGTWRGKAYIPKHMAGIDGFIRRLNEQIAANDRL